MTRIKLILLLLLFFTHNSFGNPDPCNELAGQWTGTWQRAGCIWDASVTGTTFNDVVRLQFNLTHDSPWHCTPESFIFIGTCRDAKLEVASSKTNRKLEGYIFSGFINLSDGDVDVQLNKSQ